MEQKRLYPIGIQSFDVIIRDGYRYVDKTGLVYQLAKYAPKYSFLSRPRRFGKSLLISTLKAYFEGRKDLFKGLAIERTEKDWIQHPVINFTFAKYFSSVEALRMDINNQLGKFEALYGYSSDMPSFGTRLYNLVEAAQKQTGQNVVILIDEYDNPILSVLHDADKLPQWRNTLRELYSGIKDSDPYLKFVFITGITKFSQLSIFSTLNNITNLSLRTEYSALCGITVDEMMEQMAPDIATLAEKLGLDIDAAVDKLKFNYDGYAFSHNSPEILNPFSLIKCFEANEIKPYWFESGTPTYLIEMLKKHHVEPSKIGGFTARASSFDVPTEQMVDAVPLLYQSGYITIKGYEPITETYYLDIPNNEVRIGLMESLIPNYLIQPRLTQNTVADMIYAINNGNIKAALTKLKDFFETVPYCRDINHEGHWQQMLYVIFSLFGAYADVEVHTKDGRVDMAMIYLNKLYLWEIKIDSTSQVALRQINIKKYPARFQNLNLPIIKIGINFSTTDRTIVDFRLSPHKKQGI